MRPRIARSPHDHERDEGSNKSSPAKSVGPEFEQRSYKEIGPSSRYATNLAAGDGIGLEAAQGLVLTEGFYWDHDDQSRAFGERFMKRTGRMPSMIHAGTYSATLSYLKAVKAAGSKDTEAVAAKLKELPVDDAFAKGKVLANGRMVHDLYLFEVKKPSESKKPFDYYKQLAVVPGDQAFFSAKDSGCPLTKQ